MNGAKQTTEVMDVVIHGRRAFLICKRDGDDTWWGSRSEYVGISNEKMGGIPIHRKTKDSERKVHPLRVSRYLSRGQ